MTTAIASDPLVAGAYKKMWGKDDPPRDENEKAYRQRCAEWCVVRMRAAIEAQDVDYLCRIMHNGNQASLWVFSQVTGIDAGRTNKSARVAIRKFVGDEAWESHTQAVEEAEREERERQEQEERERKEQESRELSEALDGFMDGKPMMSRRRALKVLSRLVNWRGKVMTRRDFIRALVAQGYRPVKVRDGYVIEDSSRYGYDITKTEHDYALHLVEKGGAA